MFIVGLEHEDIAYTSHHKTFLRGVNEGGMPGNCRVAWYNGGMAALLRGVNGVFALLEDCQRAYESLQLG